MNENKHFFIAKYELCTKNMQFVNQEVDTVKWIESDADARSYNEFIKSRNAYPFLFPSFFPTAVLYIGIRPN